MKGELKECEDIMVTTGGWRGEKPELGILGVDNSDTIGVDDSDIIGVDNSDIAGVDELDIIGASPPRDYGRDSFSTAITFDPPATHINNSWSIGDILSGDFR